MDPADHLSHAEELAHYRSHHNDPGDQRYRDFLDRLATPLTAALTPGAVGLDYGCGPGPTLSVMLRERGFPAADYDPFFFPDVALLDQHYDFIACSETVEHFSLPHVEFMRLFGMLHPDGVLGVMTEMVPESASFTTWRYARDPTHVSFYRPETMQWIAARFGRRLERPASSVTLFLPIDG